MLNCTDVLCILHEHHYYHHHHQHHLQDHRQHHDHDHDHDHDHHDGHHVMSDSDGVSETIQGLLNNTDSELSSLSHLDAPSDSVYMICGVLIAMVLVAMIIVLLAVTISKLRKREDHASSSVAPTDVILHTTAVASELTSGGAAGRLAPSGDPNGRIIAFSCDTSLSNQVASTAAQSTQQSDQQNGYPPPQFHGLWQYPPQYSLYSNDKETLVQPMPLSGRPGFARGLKKNLSGRWKRLVKKKSTNEVYTIPPDLRDQLKTIYVY